MCDTCKCKPKKDKSCKCDTAPCIICGNDSRNNNPDNFVLGPIRTIMERDKVCFNCAFWIEKIELHDDSTFVIHGTRYHDGGAVDKKTTRGFLGQGGRDVKIQRLDTDEIIETNNLWCQGDIPEHFRTRPELMDNAKFIQ